MRVVVSFFRSLSVYHCDFILDTEANAHRARAIPIAPDMLQIMLLSLYGTHTHHHHSHSCVARRTLIRRIW